MIQTNQQERERESQFERQPTPAKGVVKRGLFRKLLERHKSITIKLYYLLESFFFPSEYCYKISLKKRIKKLLDIGTTSKYLPPKKKYLKKEIFFFNIGCFY